MNTANLQLEGLYAAMAALVSAIRDKGVLSAEEIETLLKQAEELNLEPERQISGPNRDAIRFPFRYLRAANRAAAGGVPRSFFDIATEIGMTKDMPAHRIG